MESKVYASPLHRYHQLTRGLLYSFLAALPLFILYEALILISAPSSDIVVRISVDVWFKYLLSSLGLDALNITLLFVLVAGLFILIKKRNELQEVKSSYFGVMFVESTLWAVVVAFFELRYCTIHPSRHVATNDTRFCAIILYTRTCALIRSRII